MRLLTMLAATVLLATCVHDTEDFDLFVEEKGASLNYYIGSDEEDIQKDHDDPWDTITEKFDQETVETGKSDGGDDPWDTINDKFAQETVITGKAANTGIADEDGPWNRIEEFFPMESIHTGKTNDRYFLGVKKSMAVFLSFSYQLPTTFRARVVEVRGRVLKLEFTDGVEQYVVDAPGSWSEGTQLETGFVDATTKKDRPFLGVRFWRTVKGVSWVGDSSDIASDGGSLERGDLISNFVNNVDYD